MTSRHAATFVVLGVAAAAFSYFANNLTVATQDLSAYNPWLVASLTLLVACLAFLQKPIRHAALGWRLLAGFVAALAVLNGINAVHRLLSINLGW